MKKRLSVIFVLFILCASFSIAASASELSGFSATADRLMDEASLLTEDESAELLGRLNEASVRLNTDIVIATDNYSYGYSAAEYADYLYDSYNFGYGSTRDGLLLFINMNEREWYISTCGKAIDIFTDAGLDYIGDKIVTYLSDGDYYLAFDKFISLCDEYIYQAATNKPYDNGNLPDNAYQVGAVGEYTGSNPSERLPSYMLIVVAFGIGLVVALIVVGSMKSKLKTVRAQSGANNYVKKGSMQLTQNSDIFLYHTVKKIPRPKETSSSSPSSHGSSTHVSSSGTTHGGRGGKF